MPGRKDELAERRFAKLVDQLKAMMSAGLKPEYAASTASPLSTTTP